MATLFNQYIPQHAGTPSGGGGAPPNGPSGANRRSTGPTGHRSENESAHRTGGSSGGSEGQTASHGKESPFAGFSSLFSKFFGENKNAGGLSGILQKLKLEDWDTGDLLLIGILLLLLVEGENTELVIALGLILFLSL